jgi:hypothetical protein
MLDPKVKYRGMCYAGCVWYAIYSNDREGSFFMVTHIFG